MPELQLLRHDHAEALLDFELTNRTYFAASISDRGDEYFNQFTERLASLLAEQASGTGAFYVLVSDDASIIGRFNLKLAEDGTAELGYRVAETATGRGSRRRRSRNCVGWRLSGMGCVPSRQPHHSRTLHLKGCC